MGSGAYDKGTSTGKGNLEFSITINPFNKVKYGQNYGVLSYGMTNKLDLVTFYSEHYNKTKSSYYGLLYQIYSYKKLDIGTGIGFRNIYNTQKNGLDYFFPQILYNYKIINGYSVGGSIVSLVDSHSYKNKGFSVDISFYIPLKKVKKLNSKIEDVFFCVGLFKNSENDLSYNDLYLHYSLDFVFNTKS